MKKNFIFILVGFVIFVIGVVIFNFETRNYAVSNRLSSNIVMEKDVLSYTIDDNRAYRITNDGSNKNVNLYIDNNLSNEIKIVVSYPEFNSVEYDYEVLQNDKIKLIHIDFDSSMTLSSMSDIVSIFQVGINGLKNKVKYNYSLIAHPEIKVYVHENYKENIQFVGNYGQVYNPIR